MFGLALTQGETGRLSKDIIAQAQIVAEVTITAHKATIIPILGKRELGRFIRQTLLLITIKLKNITKRIKTMGKMKKLFNFVRKISFKTVLKSLVVVYAILVLLLLWNINDKLGYIAVFNSPDNSDTNSYLSDISDKLNSIDGALDSINAILDR